MPIPQTLEICEKHLFDDIDVLQKNNVPTIIQDRIIRIRDIYSIWINFPSKKEFELLQILISKYSISKSSAYDDLKIIKILLGSLNQTSQDFHRWRFNNWIEKTFDMEFAMKSEEAFIAGPRCEILPVTKIDRKFIADGKVGPITQKLISEYKKFVLHECPRK